MAAVPQLAQGTTLERDTGGTPLDISGLSGITGPTTSADQIDVTSHESASGFREFIRGLVDPGTISFDIWFDGTDPSQLELMADISDTSAAVVYTMTFPDLTDLVFTAKTNAFEFNVPVDGALSAAVTLQITGAITYPT